MIDLLHRWIEMTQLARVMADLHEDWSHAQDADTLWSDCRPADVATLHRCLVQTAHALSENLASHGL